MGKGVEERKWRVRVESWGRKTSFAVLTSNLHVYDIPLLS